MLWISATKADEIAVMDPSARKVVARVPVEGNPREVREGEGAVWVTHGRRGQRRDQRRFPEVAATVKVEGSPFGLAVGEGECGRRASTAGC